MTMYSNKLAVCVKAAGKVLREYETDKVYLPFQSEYSIFIKNLNSVRALVKVEIDGQDVGDGTQFIINGITGDNSLDLERFIKNGNFNQGNRFKFIERTGKVEKSRGVKAEDGLIRVEFQFEKILPKYTTGMIHSYPWGGYDPNTIFRSSFNSSIGGGSFSSSMPLANAADDVVYDSYADTSHVYTACAAAAQVNDTGITVAGSVSNQQFQAGAWFPVEDVKHVIVLKLLGIGAKGKVEKPVTVQSKPKCSTCGHINKATSKFCAECGTSLIIV